jgi:hypothetical protein
MTVLVTEMMPLEEAIIGLESETITDKQLSKKEKRKQKKS